MVIPLRDDNPARGAPLLTLLLIAACVLVFFAVQPTTGTLEEQDFLYENAAIPCEVLEGRPLSNQLVTDCGGDVFNTQTSPREEWFDHKQIYLSLLASMFLHGSIAHLGGNMLFLWIFGNNIEDRFGKIGYLALYGIAGVGATLAHVLSQPDSTIPLIGASGAIAGVMGAYLVYFPRARVLTMIPPFLFIHLPAFVVLAGWFVLQLFTNPNTGVAAMAHIGGFVIGALIAAVSKLFVNPDEDRPNPNFGFGSTYR